MSIYRICTANISHRAKRDISQKGNAVSGKTIKELSIELTVALTELCNVIQARSIYINQLLRSCSSIGANAHEARYAQSQADFISKLEISLKECYETEYWLEILYRTHSITEKQFKSLLGQSGMIRRKLIASITTAKKSGASSK